MGHPGSGQAPHSVVQLGGSAGGNNLASYIIIHFCQFGTGGRSQGAVGPVGCDYLGDLLESSRVGQLINFKSKKKPLQGGQGGTRTCRPPRIWPGTTLSGPARRGQLRRTI